MHPAFVAEVVAKLAAAHGLPTFAVLVPRLDREGYALVWEGPAVPSVEEVEALLAANYHYAHARNAGQLRPVCVVSAVRALRAWCAALGVPESAPKVPALFLPRDAGRWRALECAFMGGMRAP